MENVPPGVNQKGSVLRISKNFAQNVPLPIGDYKEVILEEGSKHLKDGIF
jgi:hypothetical protein